jgi:hypothetical protein
MWSEVQKLWGKQSKRTKPNTDENVFLRKIFCGRCGFAMRRARSGKNSFLYRCDSRQRYGKDDCTLISISETKLKSILLRNLCKRAAVYCRDIVIPVKTETVKEPSELSGVRTELSRVTGFLKGLYESLVSGDLTRSEYADMKQDYEIRIADLTERERVLTENARELHMNQIAVNKASGALGAVSLITDLTAETVDALINKILIFEDKRIEIHYKFTDEIDVGEGGDNE